MDQPSLINNASQPTDGQHPMANYQFSPEELRVLRECTSESFFQRSLPLGTGLGLMAYFGVKNGLIQPNVKYGAVPKVVTAAVIGYFIGKFSYQQKCAEKLMKLPNSQLGDMLRQRKQGGGVLQNFTPDQNFGRALTLAPFAPSQGDIYSDEEMQSTQRSSALNLDTDSRPTISGLDDIYRPSVDTPSTYMEKEIILEPAKTDTTYDELRKRNRDEFLKKQQSPYSRPLPSEAPTVMRQNELPKIDEKSDDFSKPLRGEKNKYGDIWSN